MRTVERAVRLAAGVFVGISLTLYYFVSPWFLALAAFVSLNLIQSVFTGICPAEMLVRRLLPVRVKSGGGAACCE
jgi:hypothetical protein